MAAEHSSYYCEAAADEEAWRLADARRMASLAHRLPHQHWEHANVPRELPSSEDVTNKIDLCEHKVH
jgi:hypothetical protein